MSRPQTMITVIHQTVGQVDFRRSGNQIITQIKREKSFKLFLIKNIQTFKRIYYSTFLLELSLKHHQRIQHWEAGTTVGPLADF